jgi:hypothetical protein
MWPPKANVGTEPVPLLSPRIFLSFRIHGIRELHLRFIRCNTCSSIIVFTHQSENVQFIIDERKRFFSDEQTRQSTSTSHFNLMFQRLEQIRVLLFPSWLFRGIMCLLSYAIIRSCLCLLGAFSPSLLHHALAFVASAYCSDDLAIVSTLSHQRTLT